MGKKRRRRGVSFGTVFMLAFTAVVVALCAAFLFMIVGTDVYERTGEFIRLFSQENAFDAVPVLRATPTPRPVITFIEEDTPVPKADATATPVPARSTIRLAVGGTVYVPRAVRQGAQERNAFDFMPAFEGVSGAFSGADLAIATLEGTAADSRQGYDNYNVPPELFDALRACGVDLVSLATEHALDSGYEGLDLTLSELTARGMSSAGVNREDVRATMMRIGGIQVAVLAYTYGLSDAGKAKTQNDERGVMPGLDLNAMIADVRQARVSGANLVIVLPHWGTKNKADTADTIRLMARELAQAGADVILGTHPNVVQQTQRLRVTRSDGLEYEAVVCYSLGSLMTDSRAEENTAGMIAQLDVTYDPVTRETTLGRLECVPVYVARQREEGKTVYRAVDAQNEEELERLESGERQRAEAAEAAVRSAALGLSRVEEALEQQLQETGVQSAGEIHQDLNTVSGGRQ